MDEMMLIAGVFGLGDIALVVYALRERRRRRAAVQAAACLRKQLRTTVYS